MKALVIVLVLVGLTFIGVVVYGLTHDREPAPASSSAGFGSPPPMEDGEPDEDALEEWRPPPIGELLAGALSPFAKKLELKDDRLEATRSGVTTQPARLRIPRSDDKMRVGRALLVAGGGAVIRYSCIPVPGERRRCPQQVCACAVGRHDADDFEVCGDGWVNVHKEGDDHVRCLERHSRPALVIYPEAAFVTMEPIGERAVVRLK